MAMSEDQLQRLLQHITPRSTGYATGPVSYNGKKDPKAVEAFICALKLLMRKEQMSESEVIEGLPLILQEEAAEWWLGIKDNINNLEDFETSLRKNFAPQKPAYLIYEELCTRRQSPMESTEDFLTQKRALFSLVPEPKHIERQQIDMIFGLMRIEIKDKILRSSVKTYEELLDASRSVEDVLREKENGTSAAPVLRTGRVKCSYCRNPGHTVDVCRKKMKAEGDIATTSNTIKATQAPSPSQPKFSCYGCGTPGVVRSNCRNCAGKGTNVVKKEDIGFCALNIRFGPKPRPMIYITVNGIFGSAFVDTCAKTNVASYSLYCKLAKQGCKFLRQNGQVTLADGISKDQEILTIETDILIYGRIIPTSFIVLPEAKENTTLLGVGFIQQALMVLNLAQYTWHFLDDEQNVFELYTEDFVMFRERPASSVTPINNAVAPVSVEDAPQIRRPKDVCVPHIRRHNTTATEPKEGAGCNTSNYRLKRIRPSSPLFDGHSPQWDYMMRDAQLNIHREDVQLSPHSMSLFPDHDSHSSDIGLNTIDVDLTKINDGLDSEQQLHLLSWLF